jgi:integrase
VARVWKRKDRDGWVVDYRDAYRRRRRLLAPTREEAERLLAEKIRESRQAALPVEDPEITLSGYAARWIDRIASTVARKTHKSYREMLNRHLLPAFGGVKLRALHRRHIKEFLARKRAGGLSKNSVRLIRATLSVLLSDAVDDGILLANPAQGITRRGRRGPDTITQAERQRKIRPMTPNQLETFLARAKGERPRRDWTLFLTLADAGLRPGEALALRWEDFDEAERTLSIERAVSDGEVKATKSEARRLLDLTTRLTEALSQWQSAGELDALTRDTTPSPWIFPTGTGTLLEVVAVGKWFREVLRTAKLPAFRLYDLRHSYATHLLAEGAPITYVTAQLGHARPTTTLAHYAHWIPRGDKRWVDRLAARRAEAADEVGTRSWHQTGSSTEGVSKLPETTGAGGGSRTRDLLITKSSEAPTSTHAHDLSPAEIGEEDWRW